MLSRTLAVAISALVLAGCLGPHYTYHFERGTEISHDVLPYSPGEHYLAVHAKGRPGWYVLSFETPEGEYDRELTTAAADIRAWYFPPFGANKYANPEEIYAPDLDYFVDNPDSPLFAKRAVKLDGTVHVTGDGTMIKNLALDLKSADQPDVDLKGTVRRTFQIVRLPSSPFRLAASE